MSSSSIDKLYTPFQIPEDSKFDGTNLNNWPHMLIYGATGGHNIYWKGPVTWPFELTKDLRVPPPPDREADGYKPMAVFSQNPSQIEWTLHESHAISALLMSIKIPDALGFDHMDMISEEIWKQIGKNFGATNERLREIAEKDLRDFK
jgi:hypothetical protein